MYHYFGFSTNTKGDALPGWYVEARTGSTVVPIYANEAGTLIQSVSGVNNRAKVDDAGNYDFWISEGTYDLYYFNASSVQQSRVDRSVNMGQVVADLASTTATKGAALINTPTNENLQTLITQTRNGNAAHGQAFWRKIRAGQEDLAIFINSDSTWNDTGEPLYRWVSEYLAPAAPTHTIIYRLYINGSGWQSPTTIQTGTGSRTIYVDNCAIPGSEFATTQGAKELDVLSLGRSYDLMLINQGHNLGYLLTPADYYPHMVTSVSNLMHLNPQADVFITLQNPRLRYLGFSRSVQATWRRVAAELGLGIIDVSAKFEALGNLDTPAIGGEGGTIDLAYYTQDGNGGLHPAVPDGVNIALPALGEALAERKVAGGPALNRPLNRIAQNLLSNPAYTDWTSSTPTGHSFTNCTPAKSVGYTETGIYSMAITPNASANPIKSVDLTSILSLAKKRWLIYQARVWVPANMANNTGRAQITVTNPGGNRVFTSWLTSAARDGWRWSTAMIQILDTDQTITLNLLCGDSAGADNGKTFYVDREIVHVSTVPGELDPLVTNGGFVTDLFNSRDTGIPTGYTGTLTVTGNNVSIAGATATLARAYGNLRTVPGRTYRIAWGTRTVTGAAGVTMFARGPNGGGTVIATASGITSNGSLTFTATSSSHSWMLSGGSNVTDFTVNSMTVTEVYSGIIPALRGHLVYARNSDFTPVDTTGGAGKYKIFATLGTSISLQGENAQANTKTTTAVFDFTLPSTYIPGRDITVTINANTTGTGTAGTRTVVARVYRIASDGTSSADLVTTAALTVTGAAADYAFAATGTTFAAGDRLQVSVVGVTQETDGTNTLSSVINSVRVS